MRKYVPLLLFLLIGAAPVSAQVLAQGPIIAASQSVVANQIPPASSVAFQVTNTWVGTLTFQGSSDCNTYVSMLVTSVTDGSTATTATANGMWTAANAGYQCVRVFGTAYTSGRADVQITRGYGQAKIASPQFTNVNMDRLCFSASAPDACMSRLSADIVQLNTGDRLALQDGTAALPSLTFANSTTTGLFRAAADQLAVSIAGTQSATFQAAGLNLGSTYTLNWNGDTILARDAANTLAQRNGTNVQAFRVYGNGTQYTQISHSGSNALYGTTVGSHVFDSHILLGTDNTYDIGASLATRPRNLYLGSKILNYNAIATAGQGVPSVYGFNSVVAATNTGTASIATYTNGATDGSYEVGCNVLVTTSTTHSFSCDVVYTDESNAARTMVLPMASLAGAFITNGLITNVTGAGPYESPTMNIRVKASTAITIRTSAGGTFTTVVYNARGIIVQVG